MLQAALRQAQVPAEELQAARCCGAVTNAVPTCRGGLILYRTQLPASAVRNGGLLDVCAPVHDYAKVGSSSAIFWPWQEGSQGRCVGQKLVHEGHTFKGQFSYLDPSLRRGSFSGHCNAAQLQGAFFGVLLPLGNLTVRQDQCKNVWLQQHTQQLPMAAGIGHGKVVEALF